MGAVPSDQIGLAPRKIKGYHYQGGVILVISIALLSVWSAPMSLGVPIHLYISRVSNEERRNEVL